MEKRSILIADDEYDTVSVLEQHLSQAGYNVHVARDGYTALTKARVMAPDLILLDLWIPGLRGVEVKNRLNRESMTLDIPVIFMTDNATTDEKIQGFNLKADDVVAKPFNLRELTARIDSLSLRYRERDQVLATDALTGLGNLHVFKRTILQFFNVAKRYERPFSLAVMDLDDFKIVNDTYGHAAGDHAIQALARCMKYSFRETDVLVRYGGDEFVALFPETDEHKAAEGIERFRENVSKIHLPVTSKIKIGLSVSVGLATYDKSLQQPIELFEIADKRMYAEKAAKKMSVGDKPQKPAARVAAKKKK